MVCGYEVRTSCEVSPSSVVPDGRASVIIVEAVCIIKNWYMYACICTIYVYVYKMPIIMDSNSHFLYVGLFCG